MLFCKHLVTCRAGASQRLARLGAAQTEGPLSLPTGGIPGPIAFGSMIDKSCLLWQDQCGEQGSCYVYQNSAMSRYTLVAGLVYKVMLLLNSLIKQPGL